MSVEFIVEVRSEQQRPRRAPPLGALQISLSLGVLICVVHHSSFATGAIAAAITVVEESLPTFAIERDYLARMTVLVIAELLAGEDLSFPAV
jgi:hypothetical protein